MTYSIVARDPESGAFGVAVQSHWFSVGSVVPAAEAGVGAVATQAFAEPSYGPLGVARMRAGLDARAALDELLAADDGRELRQVALVDARGGAAAHTGSECLAACGHAVGGGVSAQGNMLSSDAVWQALLPAFEATAGLLAERLLAALDAAEAAGGDARGRQSAALLVVEGPRGERPWERVTVSLRVEDHPRPLGELRRLLGVHRAYERLGAALDANGVLRGAAAEPATLEHALAELAWAQEALGERNQEPALWRTVALARSGRLDEARATLARAAAVEPTLRDLVASLGPPILDRETARAVAGS